MPRPVQPTDVLIGLLTENHPRILTQAIRLLRSLRWFGGELAAARVVVCTVGPLETSASATLQALGAELRTVQRFHPANPTANRHQLLAELLREPEEIFLLLDCDILVVGDPLPYLRRDLFQAKPAPTPTVSDEVFVRLFERFTLPLPERSRIASFSGTAMIPYFNAGVMVVPKEMARVLAPVWRRYNQLLADEPELVAPCQRHMHQASLSLALAETGMPCADLPEEMNYQINAPLSMAPPGYAELDPVLIHYHHLGDEDGFLLPSAYAGAQRGIDRFHQRMRAAGFSPQAKNKAVRAPRPVVVLGMHRSGTSAVAQLLVALGLYAGRADELAPADMFNPTGYWENNEIVELDRQILEALGATWSDPAKVDLSALSAEQRQRYVHRARSIVERSLSAHGPFVVKDPRMSLLFTLWREVLQDPICVIAWRDPLAVAESIYTRDKRPHLLTLAVWEHYTRSLLRDTEGLPRLLVSYDELLRDPSRVIREVHTALSGFGVEGLSLPSEERLRQLVNPDFNRSAHRTRTSPESLNQNQRDLVAGLASGAVLQQTMPPTSALVLDLLDEFSELESLRQQVRERSELLAAVFESRSWRAGFWLTRMLRLLRPGSAPTASDRWQDMQKRRGE